MEYCLGSTSDIIEVHKEPLLEEEISAICSGQFGLTGAAEVTWCPGSTWWLWWPGGNLVLMLCPGSTWWSRDDRGYLVVLWCPGCTFAGWPKCTDCTDFLFCNPIIVRIVRIFFKLYGFLSWKFTGFFFTHFSKFFMKISKKNLVKMKLVSAF